MDSQFGFKNKQNEYQIYIDSCKPVKINLQGFAEFGYINKIEGDYLYLLPSIVNENLSLPEGKMKYSLRIEKLRQKLIDDN